MDLRELRSRATVGGRHPWESARAVHVQRLLEPSLKTRSRLLDIGSGDSYVALSLVEAHPDLTEVACVDINYSTEDLDVVLPDERLTRTAEIPGGHYDVLLLLDVIEHVRDSRALLRALRARSASPDAVALITVPAHQGLFSEHDCALGHYRRYSRDGLRAELEGAGWAVQEVGGFFLLPLIARASQVLVSTRRRRTATRGRRPSDLGQWQHGPGLTEVVRVVLQLDAALSRACHRIGLPTLGLSWWAVATPRSQADD